MSQAIMAEQHGDRMNEVTRRAAFLLLVSSAVACGSARSTHVPAPGPAAAEFVAIKVDTMAWGEANLHPTLQWFRKRLVNDTTARGIYVSLLRYPAGVINPSHTHPHPHGFYVLQGQLVTNRGTFEAGTFVWFPAGGVIHHGAGTKEDMVAVFVSGAPFKIDYVNR
jgi:quercetin dioxygenase-like cupin family protein